VTNGLLFTADHETVAAFQSPHAATGAAVHVMDALGRERRGTRDVVVIMAVAAVDHDVALVEMLDEPIDHGAGHARGNHEPNRSGRSQLAGQFVEGVGTACSLLDE
jgi:hypothetical protein